MRRISPTVPLKESRSRERPKKVPKMQHIQWNAMTVAGGGMYSNRSSFFESYRPHEMLKVIIPINRNRPARIGPLIRAQSLQTPREHIWDKWSFKVLNVAHSINGFSSITFVRSCERISVFQGNWMPCSVPSRKVWTFVLSQHCWQTAAHFLRNSEITRNFLLISSSFSELSCTLSDRSRRQRVSDLPAAHPATFPEPKG